VLSYLFIVIGENGGLYYNDTGVRSLFTYNIVRVLSRLFVYLFIKVE
jgi:hypothetical protein